MKLKLVKGKTAHEAASAANGTGSDGNTNHRTKVLRDLVEHRPGKECRVVVVY